MSTLTVYAGTSDGLVQSYDIDYALARAGGSIGTSNNGTSINIGQRLNVAYYCYEAFFEFDTSAVGSGSTATSAILSLYANTDSSATDFVFEARAFDWGGVIGVEDFVAGDSLAGLTLLGTYSSASGWSAYHAFSDVAMSANVNSTGMTRLVVASDRMRLGNAPTGNEYVSCKAAETTGTTQDPKLVVTYSVSAPSSPAWVSPADGTNISSSTPFVFTSLVSANPAHFELQFDTVNTFDSGNLKRLRSYLDSGWEYWDGAAWQPLTASGMPAAKTGNNVRYTPSPALSSGTWYRRVRQNT